MEISIVDSNVAFNKRVLSLGDIKPDGIYTMEDLRDSLFFNQIFLSNMNEVFQKLPWNEIRFEYKELINRYQHNVRQIIEKIMEINPDIQICYTTDFEQRLFIERNVSKQIISNMYSPSKDIKIKFKEDTIYYITILQNGCICISQIDPKASIYNSPVSTISSGYTIYWKTDESIRTYLCSKYTAKTAFSIKVTKSKSNHSIVKVEYSGDSLHVNYINYIAQYLFDEDCFMIYNPYLYTEDIQKIIEINSEHIPMQVHQGFDELTLERIFEKDMLIEYPILSFDAYLHLLSLAVNDPDTKGIYLSLYRIGNSADIYYILRDAVQRGIYVHVNIELHASGETINQMWMQEMKKIGIDVSTYASGKLKVHSKLTLISSKKGDIAQIGTGNYHPKTTSEYTDLSLITSDQNVCMQIANIFSILKGDEKEFTFDSDLLVTRYNTRNELNARIGIESSLGSKGFISIKCNALTDPYIIDRLDQAAKNGCVIHLIIRGICIWVPEQLGRNVMIKSVIWDKLEHSRVYCFGKEDPTIYIGSLDPVPNKLDKRIESLVKIKDPEILSSLCDYLNRYIMNSENSWVLMKSGEYIKE